jgi:hypothetical protein
MQVLLMQKYKFTSCHTVWFTVQGFLFSRIPCTIEEAVRLIFDKVKN